MPRSSVLDDTLRAVIHNNCLNSDPCFEAVLTATVNTGALTLLFFFQWVQGTKLGVVRNPVMTVIGMSPTKCS